MSAGWTAHLLPSLTGTTAVVTGATSGLGLETSRALAAAGAHVILAVRNTERGAQTAAEIGGSTEVRRLDLADLASIRTFAESTPEPIDLLINNAGLFAHKHEQTVDGFELALGINFLGTHALTALLLPQVRDRVITVASNAHRSGHLDLADMHLSHGWSGPRSYANSKLAAMLWQLDLDRRLREARSGVRMIAADPGWSATSMSDKPGLELLHRVAYRLATTFGNDAATGARPILYAATAPLAGGSYVGFDGRGGVKGAVTLIGRSATASNPRLARWVGRFAEAETGIALALPVGSPGRP